MISTGQLDGERTLKPKFALQDTQKNIQCLQGADEEQFSVYCSEPNAYLFYFDALAEIRMEDGSYEHR